MERFLDWEDVFKQFLEYTFSVYGREHLEKISKECVNNEEYEYLQEVFDIQVTLGLPVFQKVEDIRPLLQKTKNYPILEPYEIFKIKEFMLLVHSLKEAISSTRYKVSFYISKLGNYDTLINEIESVFEPDGNFKDKASKNLSVIRKEQKRLSLEIKEKIEKFISKNSRYLQEQLYTIRNGRYVFIIKSGARGHLKGIVHGVSNTGVSLFFEPQEFIHLNDKIEILRSEEKIEINKILRGITSKIHDRYAHLINDIKIVGHIDSLFARAKYAYKNNGIVVKPEGTYLKLVNARHPLISRDKVVPISIDIPKDKKGLIITGPNTGGKTVTLKTISLFIFMSQHGFPILSDIGTRIPNFKLFVDIGDSQNVVENLSTFSSHMVRIIEALKDADENSLVVIDELGSGTDPFEGSALAIAIIEHLLEKNIKFIITTHLTNVKLFAMERDDIMTASMEFDINTLSPTYRLLLNTPGASHAFEISERLGLNKDIIDRAKRYISEDHLKIENIIKHLNLKVSELEEKKKLLEKTLKEYERLKSEYEKKYNILKLKKIEELDKELRNIYREFRTAKREIQSALFSTKTNSEELIKKKLKRLEQKEKDITQVDKTLESLKYPNIAQEITKGDYVKLVDGTAVGRIIEKRQNGKILVDFNGLKIEVKKSKLRKVEPPKKDEEPILYQSISVLSSNEIDLRGKTVEEAIELVDKFIDDLIYSDYSTGYIVHGKGTGSLASNIWNFLRKDKRIKSYRFGRPSEGGVGVTVVEV
ncbi:endonuclease MutS2 [Thermosipho sp. 1244]|uniref:endonuclease MutS2 n=1 Tax=Thermosipho sp. 1244 TaxID=1755816 RepID=UPI001BDE672B|nr:endonuclease MutS2 [Thermosipho sp. 1244]MBT1248664.1 DNA mismatch repair protein MutS [Thermosipho sp. 1244]